MMRINKAERLGHIDWFREIAMEKGVVSIKLSNRLITRQDKSEDNVDGGGFNNETRGINIVNTRGLMVPFGNKTCFVVIK